MQQKERKGILKNKFMGNSIKFRGWSKGCLSLKPLKLSREAMWQVSEIPYHTGFIAWWVNIFFFYTRGGGAVQLLGETFEPFP